MINSTQIAHHIPGRLRLRLPHMKGNPAMLEAVKQSLSPLPGVKQVEVKPTTGSVVVEYDAARYHEFFDLIDKHAGPQRILKFKPRERAQIAEIVARIEAETEFISENSTLAEIIHK